MDDLTEEIRKTRVAMAKDEGCYSADEPCPRLASGTLHVEVCCKEGESAETCLARFEERLHGATVWCNQ